MGSHVYVCVQRSGGVYVVNIANLGTLMEAMSPCRRPIEAGLRSSSPHRTTALRQSRVICRLCPPVTSDCAMRHFSERVSDRLQVNLDQDLRHRLSPSCPLWCRIIRAASWTSQVGIRKRCASIGTRGQQRCRCSSSDHCFLDLRAIHDDHPGRSHLLGRTRLDH
jgi:hypothetical protein